MFQLRQQQLIELIRQGAVEAALKFAQEELALRGEGNVSAHILFFLLLIAVNFPSP